MEDKVYHHFIKHKLSFLVTDRCTISRYQDLDQDSPKVTSTKAKDKNTPYMKYNVLIYKDE